MFRKMTLTILLLAGCVWCSALVSPVDSAQPAPSNRPFKPVLAVHRLMEGQGLVFKQLNGALANQETPHRIEMIEINAGLLAELANVNTLNKDKEDYRSWARQLSETAMELSDEAEKKAGADEARMNRLFGQMKNLCQSCHDVYQETP